MANSDKTEVTMQLLQALNKVDVAEAELRRIPFAHIMRKMAARRRLREAHEELTAANLAAEAYYKEHGSFK